ncbi:MAG: hypothetical protein WC728_08875 [Elusimicrobiota bacterium]
MTSCFLQALFAFGILRSAHALEPKPLFQDEIQVHVSRPARKRGRRAVKKKADGVAVSTSAARVAISTAAAKIESKFPVVPAPGKKKAKPAEPLEARGALKSFPEQGKLRPAPSGPAVPAVPKPVSKGASVAVDGGAVERLIREYQAQKQKKPAASPKKAVKKDPPVVRRLDAVQAPVQTSAASQPAMAPVQTAPAPRPSLREEKDRAPRASTPEPRPKSPPVPPPQPKPKASSPKPEELRAPPPPVQKPVPVQASVPAKPAGKSVISEPAVVKPPPAAKPAPEEPSSPRTGAGAAQNKGSAPSGSGKKSSSKGKSSSSGSSSSSGGDPGSEGSAAPKPKPKPPPKPMPKPKPQPKAQPKPQPPKPQPAPGPEKKTPPAKEKPQPKTILPPPYSGPLIPVIPEDVRLKEPPAALLPPFSTEAATGSTGVQLLPATIKDRVQTDVLAKEAFLKENALASPGWHEDKGVRYYTHPDRQGLLQVHPAGGWFWAQSHKGLWWWSHPASSRWLAQDKGDWWHHSPKKGWTFWDDKTDRFYLMEPGRMLRDDPKGHEAVYFTPDRKLAAHVLGPKRKAYLYSLPAFVPVAELGEGVKAVRFIQDGTNNGKKAVSIQYGDGRTRMVGMDGKPYGAPEPTGLPGGRAELEKLVDELGREPEAPPRVRGRAVTR